MSSDSPTLDCWKFKEVDHIEDEVKIRQREIIVQPKIFIYTEVYYVLTQNFEYVKLRLKFKA